MRHRSSCGGENNRKERKWPINSAGRSLCGEPPTRGSPGPSLGRPRAIPRYQALGHLRSRAPPGPTAADRAPLAGAFAAAADIRPTILSAISS